MLPIPALPSDTLEIEGMSVPYHSLSRSQALKVHSFVGREDEAETYILSCGVDVSLEEAQAWRESVDVATAGKLIDAIIIISGLTNGSEE
jgi:hypothetical protein